MEGVREPFEKDIARLKFSYPGSALKVPVYSFFDARNMQDDAGITHVLDMGPGKTSQRLTQDTLKGMGSETPVLAAGVPKDLKTLLA